MATNGSKEKQLIVSDLLDAVKQSQIRFGGRSELATDFDQRIVKLCESLEKALSDGLRTDRKLINYHRKMVSNGMTRSSSAGQGWSDSQETTVCFWHFVSLHLTRHELDRYLLLRNVRTDTGRGKAWLRSALNEHSLERYMLTLLSDSLTFRNQFYDDSALIRDEDFTSLLPTIARGLNSILFAINIDNSEFDVFPNNSKAIDISGPSDPLPVRCKSSPNDSTSGSRRTRRTRVNVISLSDDDDQSEGTISARSAPTTCLSSPDSVFQSKRFLGNDFSEETNKSEAKSELYAIGTTDSDVVLTPFIQTENTSALELIVDDNVSDSDKLSSNDNQDLHKFELSHESNADKEELDRIKAELNVLRNKYEENVSKLELQNDCLQKDNNLLQIQLNKYIAAVQLLRHNNKSDNQYSNQTPDNCDSNEDSVSQKLAQMQNQSYSNEVNEYERKLVEVAQMHAELVEFNTHLHRVIRQKDALITRLKDELIDLRGPLPEGAEATEDLMSISSDFETDLSIQSSISHPLIHIWIPTVFLAGGQKSKSHHIYQIYVRIRDDEWNVYRRYSQFHSLHKTLRKKFQVLNAYDFPPKKTIGNKDSKVVQERRKKLEHYLRNLINVLQSQHNISDKQRLIEVLPFLSERFIQNDSRSRSDTHLNLSNSSEQRPEPHYMGL